MTPFHVVACVPSEPPGVRMPKVTPLLRFLRALTTEQREAFARACGTTVGYLYQLAAQPEPNPRLRLAFALAAESRRIHRKVHADPLTLPDLIVGPDPHREKTND